VKPLREKTPILVFGIVEANIAISTLKSVADNLEIADEIGRGGGAGSSCRSRLFAQYALASYS
jgi:hypothetical protein